MKKGKEYKRDRGAKIGYWMYKDGSIVWGRGIQRFTEVPIRIELTDETKKKELTCLLNCPVEDRIKWYKEETAKEKA